MYNTLPKTVAEKNGGNETPLIISKMGKTFGGIRRLMVEYYSVSIFRC